MRPEVAARPSAPLPVFDVGQTGNELGRVVVWVLGELDVWGAPDLCARLDDLAARRRATLLDLSATTFIDCAGVAVVLRATQASERDGWSFAIAGRTPSAVADLLDFARARQAAAPGRDA